MALEIQILILILLLLLIGLFILIRITDYIRKISLNNIKIVEKHVINNNVDNEKVIKKEVGETKGNINEINDLDSKWSKNRTVESNMNNLGEEKKVNASASNDAVRLMRELKKKKQSD